MILEWLILLFIAGLCHHGHSRQAYTVTSSEHAAKFIVLSDIGSENKTNDQRHLSCVKKEAHHVQCSDGLDYENEELLDSSHPEFWTYLGISLMLIVCAGIMSGLQLGLLSLDYNTLMVYHNAGEPHERRYARKIEPLIRRRHLLLVTLLIMNAACLEALPLFLDKLMTPAANIIVSVTAVLFFGEIFPQSLCVRYGMGVGAFFAPLVWLCIGLTFPISWPLSKLLDAILGHGEATFFRRGELKELVMLQQEQGCGEEKLTEAETNIIKGALEMSAKTVKDCMTPIDTVFMLDMDGVLDTATMKAIQDGGHSRIPIYHKTRNTIVGMILVKDLLLMDPKEQTSIRHLVVRKVPTVSTGKPLYEMLNLFQTGRSHLAEVVDADDCLTVVGVVTLEDVIEELIGEEISDETDTVCKGESLRGQNAQLGRLTGVKRARLEDHHKGHLAESSSEESQGPTEDPPVVISSPSVEDDERSLLH